MVLEAWASGQERSGRHSGWQRRPAAGLEHQKFLTLKFFLNSGPGTELELETPSEAQDHQIAAVPGLGL